MLWAKVKENTLNQVEVERNRAITQETRIIETKADKSELGNCVSDTALKALEKKVSANTAAISNKQDAGNYLHCEPLNNEGYYEIPDVCISGSDGSTKTNIDSQSVSVIEDNGTTASIASDEIRVSNESLGYTIITPNRVRHFYSNDGDFGFDLNSDGIKLHGGDDNHVLTSNASTIDITQYVLKSELPTVPTKVSQLTNDSNLITAADVDFTPYATTEALQAETTARTEANAALENKIAAKQDKITPKTIGNYQVGSEDESLTTDNIKALRALVLDLKSVLVQSGLIVNSAV